MSSRRSQTEHRPSEDFSVQTTTAVSEKLPTYDETNAGAHNTSNSSLAATGATSRSLRSGKALDGPPPYSSLFPTPNQLGRHFRRRMSRPTNGDGEQPRFILTCCRATCITIIMLLIIGIVFVLPVTMIVIGTQHLDDCPIQQYIPIFLVVMGVIQMIECCGRVMYHMSREEEDDNEGTKDVCIFFLVAWFIAGNVWVFGNYSSYSSIKACNTTSTITPNSGCNGGISEEYCDDMTMKFAFWVIIFLYVILGFVVVALCAYCCVKAMATNPVDSSQE